MSNELNLEVMDVDTMSLEDILAENDKYIHTGTSKGRFIPLDHKFTINKSQLARLIQAGKFNDVCLARQVRLIIKLAIAVGTEVFTFGDIDELASDYISKWLEDGKRDTSHAPTNDLWSFTTGRRYKQLPSIAGATYIDWLVGASEYCTSTSDQGAHARKLGIYNLFVKVTD